MRTGRDTPKEILHLASNLDRDNRKELVENIRGSRKVG
jgi:hypothetical protein